MICPECGYPLAETVDFCPECGYPFTEAEKKEAKIEELQKQVKSLSELNAAHEAETKRLSEKLQENESEKADLVEQIKHGREESENLSEQLKQEKAAAKSLTKQLAIERSEREHENKPSDTSVETDDSSHLAGMEAVGLAAPEEIVEHRDIHTSAENINSDIPDFVPIQELTKPTEHTKDKRVRIDTKKFAGVASKIKGMSLKKALIAVGTGVVLGLLIGFVIFLVTGKNSYKLAKEYYEAKDLTAYEEVYPELDDKEIAKLGEIFISDATELEEAYISGNAEYNDVVESLSIISKFDKAGTVSDLEDKKQSIRNLENSRKAFVSGEEKSSSGDYAGAYSQYEKVIESDDNYASAQSKMEEMRKGLYDEYVGKAEGYVADHNYTPAISMLNRAKEYTDDSSDIEAQIAEYNRIMEEEKRLAEEERRANALIVPGQEFSTTHADMTFVSGELTDHIYPDKRTGYYTYYSVNVPDTTWLDLKFSVKNTSTGLLNLDAMVEELKAVYNESYEYKTYGLYYSAGNNKIDKIYQYISNSIDPLQTVTLHIIIEMPLESKTTDYPLEVSMKLDNEEKIFVYR